MRRGKLALMNAIVFAIVQNAFNVLLLACALENVNNKSLFDLGKSRPTSSGNVRSYSIALTQSPLRIESQSQPYQTFHHNPGKWSNLRFLHHIPDIWFLGWTKRHYNKLSKPRIRRTG
jgi:hypothetical protein